MFIVEVFLFFVFVFVFFFFWGGGGRVTSVVQTRNTGWGHCW